MDTLYWDLGGISAVRTTANALYDLLCQDALLAKRANAIDKAELTDRLEAFLTFTFGGSPYYEGHSLRTDYAALLVSDADFDRFCRHVPTALNAVNATSVAHDAATTAIEHMRDFVLNKRIAQTA